MKIAFDGQLLFEGQKTGIGYTAEYIINNMITEYEEEYYINYFSIKKNKLRLHQMQSYKDKGCKVNNCGWFHNIIYKRIWNKIKLPYGLFFNERCDITQFFNYDVPPGIKGHGVTFIYDMVYKAFPETISKETYKMLDDNLEVACKRADHIVTISEFSKKEIIKYMNIDESKISIMPCGVDLTRFHSQHKKEDIETAKSRYNIDGPYILYLGTLEPRKNIERLVQAYAELKKEMQLLPKLVIAGKKGWMFEQIFEIVDEMDLNDDVIFTGYVDEKDVPLLLSGAEIFTFPSLYEGFGLPPLEAMACGTAVVVSNQASLPEVVGDAGVLVDPYDINDISNGIKKLLADDKLRTELAQRGMNRANLYTWKDSARILHEIYKSILK